MSQREVILIAVGLAVGGVVVAAILKRAANPPVTVEHVDTVL